MDMLAELNFLQKAVKIAQEHSDSTELLENVVRFVNCFDDERALEACSFEWDDLNKGLLLLWSSKIESYSYKADLLICSDYYNYYFRLEEPNGKYINSYCDTDHSFDDGAGSVYPLFFKWIVEHIESVFK